MIDLLEMCPLYVWRYNGAVQIVNFPENAFVQIGARGSCPHCSTPSYFRPLGSAVQIGNKCAGTCQCEACKEFVLVVGARPGPNNTAVLVAVYPLGRPNDNVAPEVTAAAKGVADDFAEALRCQWVRAYKACVVMCARAIQGSAIALGAKKKVLTEQIDELFSQGKITEALKDFVHEIRVTRNIGAHPDKDGLEDITDGDASDIVEFTREYLHHVYVMPAKLKARKSATPTTPP